jgi:hypothetical protein
MPQRPSTPHRLAGGRDYRRVVTSQQNDATGAGTGSSGTAPDTASYWVLEEDGTSKWQLEEGNGFWILEESS